MEREVFGFLVGRGYRDAAAGTRRECGKLDCYGPSLAGLALIVHCSLVIEE